LAEYTLAFWEHCTSLSAETVLSSGESLMTESRKWRKQPSTSVGKKGGVQYRLEELGTDDGLLTDPQGIHSAVMNFFTRWFSNESKVEAPIVATGFHWTQLQEKICPLAPL
jgi:hypothetical protein